MTAALEGGEWSAARSAPHFTRGKDAVPILLEWWVGPRVGLDGRKIASPPGFDPGPSSPVALSLYRLSYRAHNVINVNSCNSATNWRVEKIKYLINMYLFIQLKPWSTSRYTVFDVIRCRLSVSFSNHNSSAVKRTESRKCHIQLAMGKTGDGRHIATWLNVCTWALLIVTANVILMCNWLCCADFKQLHNCVRIDRWHAQDSSNSCTNVSG